MVKNTSASAGDTEVLGSIPGLGRSPGGGTGNHFSSPAWENPRDRGAWWAAVRGVAKSHTWLSIHTVMLMVYLGGPIQLDLAVYPFSVWQSASTEVPVLPSPIHPLWVYLCFIDRFICIILYFIFYWVLLIYNGLPICYTATWLSYTQVYFFKYSFPSWFITGYWI